MIYDNLKRPVELQKSKRKEEESLTGEEVRGEIDHWEGERKYETKSKMTKKRTFLNVNATLATLLYAIDCKYHVSHSLWLGTGLGLVAYELASCPVPACFIFHYFQDTINIAGHVRLRAKLIWTCCWWLFHRRCFSCFICCHNAKVLRVKLFGMVAIMHPGGHQLVSLIRRIGQRSRQNPPAQRVVNKKLRAEAKQCQIPRIRQITFTKLLVRRIIRSHGFAPHVQHLQSSSRGVRADSQSLPPEPGCWNQRSALLRLHRFRQQRRDIPVDECEQCASASLFSVSSKNPIEIWHHGYAALRLHCRVDSQMAAGEEWPGNSYSQTSGIFRHRRFAYSFLRRLNRHILPMREFQRVQQSHHLGYHSCWVLPVDDIRPDVEPYSVSTIFDEDAEWRLWLRAFVLAQSVYWRDLWHFSAKCWHHG